MESIDKIIPTGKFLARIDEQQCIGCTLCIKACPFDAIIGASKHMHTVLNQYCTGCNLCIPPCPVDCIEMIENHQYKKACDSLLEKELSSLRKIFAEFSRKNKKNHEIRLNKIKQRKQEEFEKQRRELLKRQ